MLFTGCNVIVEVVSLNEGDTDSQREVKRLQYNKCNADHKSHVSYDIMLSVI